MDVPISEFCLTPKAPKVRDEVTVYKHLLREGKYLILVVDVVLDRMHRLYGCCRCESPAAATCHLVLYETDFAISKPIHSQALFLTVQPMVIVEAHSFSFGVVIAFPIGALVPIKLLVMWP